MLEEEAREAGEASCGMERGLSKPVGPRSYWQHWVSDEVLKVALLRAVL